MCWRGHPKSRISKSTGNCLECQRRRSWYYKTGRTPPKRNVVTLNVNYFHKHRKCGFEVLSDLSTIPKFTIYSWVYGWKYRKVPVATSEDLARKLSLAMRVPFSKLWRPI